MLWGNELNELTAFHLQRQQDMVESIISDPEHRNRLLDHLYGVQQPGAVMRILSRIRLHRK